MYAGDTPLGPGRIAARRLHAGHEIGVDWAQFSDDADGRIELFDHARFGKRLGVPVAPSQRNGLTFRVDDLDGEVRRLREHGVEFLAESWHDWGGAAHFHDPEGNHLQLFQVCS
ncbi:MAG TPA: VOC family protein [Gaiellaceae bacterium]|nr:VOC family protein [Gaiellaceae bacterium]